jgi:spore germination protein KC
MWSKKFIAVILLLCLSCLLPGCWNRRELNTLGITGMVGVDKAGADIQVTFEIIKPQKAGGEKPAETASYVQATGRTLFDAFRNITLKGDRRIFGPFIKVWVFSAEAAHDIAVMDMISRDHELRLSTPLLIAQDASAAEVMGIAGGIQDLPSGYLEDIWKGQWYNGKSVNVTILDFLKAYLTKGKNPVAGVVRKVKKVKTAGQDQEYELSTEGAAVFVNNRLVGFLDGMETRGYNWIAGKEANWLAVSALPGGEGLIVMEVLKAHPKKEVEIVDGIVKISVKLAVTGKVGEVTGVLDLANPATISMLEHLAAQAIKTEAEHTLDKVQHEYRSDIYGFGQVVHRQYPREWKDMQNNWDEIFATAETTVAVDVTLTQSGKNIHTPKK